jgi:hypothetical protein
VPCGVLCKKPGACALRQDYLVSPETVRPSRSVPRIQLPGPPKFLAKSSRLCLCYSYLMRLRMLAASLVLLMFGMSATQLGLAMSGWLQPAPARETAVCPMHRAKCCCPSLCNVRRPQAKPSCHKSPTASAESETETDSSASCVMKAGCRPSDHVGQTMNSLKDLLVEPSEALHCTIEVSPLMTSLVASPQLGFLPKPFHPPKIA